MLSITARLAGIFRQVPGIRGFLSAPGNYRIASTNAGTGRIYSIARAPDTIQRFIRGVITAAGITNLVDFFIPDSILGTFNLDDVGGALGFGDDTMHPAPVVKRWSTPTANFVRLADGRAGAQKKDGTWKYWRYPKSVPVYANGTRDIRSLLKADKALTKQFRDLKKHTDRRFPRTPSKQPKVQVIKESGSGELIITK